MNIPLDKPGGISFNAVVEIIGKEELEEGYEYLYEENEDLRFWTQHVEDLTFFYNVFEKWNENKPSKKILDDFKESIIVSDLLLQLCGKISDEYTGREERYVLINLIPKLIEHGALVTEDCLCEIERENLIDETRRILKNFREEQNN